MSTQALNQLEVISRKFILRDPHRLLDICKKIKKLLHWNSVKFWEVTNRIAPNLINLLKVIQWDHFR